MEEKPCCPKFNPKPWDKKLFGWKDKRFIKGKVFTFFYMPINFGGVVRKLMKKIESSGAKTSSYMGLSDHTSKWNMDLYIPVDKKVEGVENVIFNGKFLSKVYEGDFKKTKEWCEDFGKYAKSKKLKIEKWFMWYTTCPKCAKKYGKNYVVIIAKVK